MTWASDQQSGRRVTAPIACRVTLGDLNRLGTKIRQDIPDTCQVPLHVASRVMSTQPDYAVPRN